MEKIKKYKHEIGFHALLNVIVSFFISLSSYVHIPYGGVKGAFVYIIHFVVLQFTLFGFLYVYSLSKTFFRLTFPILFTILSALAFWVYTQDITVESTVIEVSQTILPV